MPWREDGKAWICSDDSQLPPYDVGDGEEECPEGEDEKNVPPKPSPSLTTPSSTTSSTSTTTSTTSSQFTSTASSSSRPSHVSTTEKNDEKSEKLEEKMKDADQKIQDAKSLKEVFSVMHRVNNTFIFR